MERVKPQITQMNTDWIGRGAVSGAGRCVSRRGTFPRSNHECHRRQQ